MTVTIDRIGSDRIGYTWVFFRSLPPNAKADTTKDWGLCFDPKDGAWEAIKFTAHSSWDDHPERLDDFLALLTEEQKAAAVANAMRARR